MGCVFRRSRSSRMVYSGCAGGVIDILTGAASGGFADVCDGFTPVKEADALRTEDPTLDHGRGRIIACS